MKTKTDPNHVGIAVVGLGRGRRHASSAAQVKGGELLAVCDINAELAQANAAEYNADYYTEYSDLLKRDDIDLISVCTPSGIHCQQAIQAAEAGKHVLSEKPIDVKLPIIDQAVAAFEERGLKLGCIFQNRLAPANQEIYRTVSAGRLGQLTLTTAHIKWYRPQEYYEKNDGWRGTWALDGGGSLMNQSVHTIDLTQWLMGPVKSVCAVTQVWSHDIETEDMGVALVKFENGAFGTIVGSTATYPGFGTNLEIHGVNGGICMYNNRITAWKIHGEDMEAEEQEVLSRFAAGKPKAKSAAQDPEAIESDTTFQQVQDMVDAIREDRDPVISGKEGRNAVEIILAIYESARRGQEVTLPL